MRGCQRDTNIVTRWCELAWCITEDWLATIWTVGLYVWFWTKKCFENFSGMLRGCQRGIHGGAQWHELTWSIILRMACENMNQRMKKLYITRIYLWNGLGMIKRRQRASNSVRRRCELAWPIAEGWLAKTWANGYNAWFIARLYQEIVLILARWSIIVWHGGMNCSAVAVARWRDVVLRLLRGC